MGALEQVMQTHGIQKSWPNTALICSSTAIYCLVIQMLVRLGSKFIKKDDRNLASLIKTIVEFYRCEEQMPSHCALLEANLKFSDFLLNAYLLFFFGLFCVPNPTAWILSWYTGELTLFVPIYLPGVDPTTLTGYAINSVLLIYYTFLVYVCFMTADVVFMYFVYQCVPMIDIICMKLDEFGEKLREVKVEKKIEVRPLQPSTSRALPQTVSRTQTEQERAKEIARVEQTLVELIKEFNSYNEYIYAAIEFMELTTFAAMTLNAMAMGMAIVVAFHSSKAIGGAVFVALFFQVLIPCIQGTLISHQKEKLENKVFAFPWYELTVAKQKLFLQFIHLVQNSNEFKIPIIGVINMALFTDVMNATLSYFMYLLKFS